MLIVDSLIISGVRFVLTRIAEAVRAEMYDESALREELLAAQMKLELGEISEEEFSTIEEEILAGMREVRARREEGGGGVSFDDVPPGERKLTVESVEATFDRAEETPD